jgi:DNA-binding transcriptional regulator YdaS (Cro superfamily)
MRKAPSFSPLKALDRAIAILGTQKALAEALGVSREAINAYRKLGRAPAERCLDIETATHGLVTRYQLRPDIYGAAPAAAARPRNGRRASASSP